MQFDGRRAGGESQRRPLVEAVLRLLEREGIGGVSYRAVAREAQVSPNAVHYHFGSIDNLLLESIRVATATWAEAVAALHPDKFAAELSELLSREVAENRGRLVADFELYLLAGRRPSLRQAARAWAEAVLVALDDLTDIESRRLIAIMDGLYVQLLLADEPLPRQTLEVLIDDALPDRHRSRRTGRGS